MTKNNCTVDLIRVAGYDEALYGILLSRGFVAEIDFLEYMENNELKQRAFKIAKNLINKQGGHNKFLESIQVWLLMDMPRYFWQQFDTYRIGTKQSESTMYTLTKRHATMKDFVNGTDQIPVIALNSAIDLYKQGKDVNVKANLPEGYLQKRMLNFSLKSLQNVYMQREKHPLAEWELVNDTIRNIFIKYFGCEYD